jgi:pantothenate kinase
MASAANIDVGSALARAADLLEATPTGTRRVLGIVGSPGSGKSTLARRIVAALGPAAVQVPMDGFHLANVSLDALGRHDRKGAIDTFDADGYVALVRRLAGPGGTERPVWAPEFDRRVDEPVAGSIAVGPDVRLVVTEGNYLLDELSPWNELPGLFVETWFCDVDDAVRVDRLVARHMRHGRDHDAALAWALDVDGVNARRVAAGASRATVIVRT